MHGVLPPQPTGVVLKHDSVVLSTYMYKYMQADFMLCDHAGVSVEEIGARFLNTDIFLPLLCFNQLNYMT
jgi:hypothetical protein